MDQQAPQPPSLGISKRSIKIIVATMMAITLLWLSRNQPPAKILEEKVWPIDSYTIDDSEHGIQVRLIGQIESPHTSQLSSAISAQVLETLVHDGEFVKEGDIIVRLDQRRERYALQQRQAELQQLQAQEQSEINSYLHDKEAFAHENELLQLQMKAFERQNKLVKSDFASSAQFDEAKKAVNELRLRISSRKNAIDNHKHLLNNLEAQIKQAQSKIEDAQLALDYTLIKAPYSGRITQVNVAAGDHVQVGEIVAEIFDTAHPELRAQLPTRYLHQLQRALLLGKQVSGSVSIEGKPMAIKLTRISGKVTAGDSGPDGLFRVYNNNTPLSLGRSLGFTISLPKIKHLIAIPQQALYSNRYVYKVTSDYKKQNGHGKTERLVSIPVEVVGRSAEDSALILVKSNLLKSGDKVLANHLTYARNGMAVTTVAKRHEKK